MERNNWEILLDRFGSLGKDSIEKFGKEYFNGIEGWQFPEETVKEANKNGQLLTMDLDIPCIPQNGKKPLCKLNCTYCFAKVGETSGTYYRPDKGDKPLTMTEIKQKMIEAKELGLQSAKVIGYREPFEDGQIFDFIDFATENDIHLVLFVAGYTLGEDRFGGDLKKVVDFLATRKVSLMVKFHTLNRNKEDQIVRFQGYSELRDKYLKTLLDDGRFNNKTPTRLGIENVIASQDSDELSSQYNYFKICRNVFVDLDPPIPVGRTGTLEEAEKAGLLSQDKLIELCAKIYKSNQHDGIPFKGISPYFGGDPCTQLPNGLYLTLSGKVNTCCGGNEAIGDVRENSLAEIFKNNPYRKKNLPLYHDCPYRQATGVFTRKFIRKVKKRIKKLK